MTILGGFILLVATYCGGTTENETGIDGATSDAQSGGNTNDAAPIAVDANEGGGGIDWGSLHGKRPSSPKPIVDFAALNYDNSARTKSDLLGKPTVLWFFPFANTPG